MDTHRDFKRFQTLMDQLCAALRGSKEAGNAFVNAYWDALKDISIEEVDANVKRIIATATKETPFPKPRELRTRAPPASVDPRTEAITRTNLNNWRDLHARDPVTYAIESGLARTARALAMLDEGDPGYEETLREYQHWASVRYAPDDVRARAVARYAHT